MLSGISRISFITTPAFSTRSCSFSCADADKTNPTTNMSVRITFDIPSPENVTIPASTTERYRSLKCWMALCLSKWECRKTYRMVLSDKDYLGAGHDLLVLRRPCQG